MDTVKVQNTITGKVGTVPAKLYNSTAFNKDDAWVLYDGSLDPDCGCNGQSVPEPEEIVSVPEIDDYSEEEVY